MAMSGWCSATARSSDGALPGLCDDFEAGPLQKLREGPADQGRIVGQNQAQRHGRVTSVRLAARESGGQR